MTRNQRWGLVALAVAAILAAVTWRRTPASHGQDAATIAMAKKFAEVTAAKPVLPVEHPEAIAASLLARWPVDSALADETMQRSACAAIAEFLRLRGARDADGYIAWAQTRGMRLRTDMASDEIVKYWLQRCPKTTASADAKADPESLFRTLFLCHLSGERSRGRAVAIAADPDSVFIGAFRQTDPTQSLPEPDHTPMGDLWFGGIASNVPPCWMPVVPRRELIAKHGGVWTARLSIVCVNDEGARFPLHALLVYQPAIGEWCIERAWVSTVTDEAITPPFV